MASQTGTDSQLKEEKLWVHMNIDTTNSVHLTSVFKLKSASGVNINETLERAENLEANDEAGVSINLPQNGGREKIPHSST